MYERENIFIALGANLPFEHSTPQDTLARALQFLPTQGIRIVRVSAFWKSPAWPDPGKPDYVNAVAEIATHKTPRQLLATLLAVEQKFGRRRTERWDSRTLDLDLIDFEYIVLNSEKLTLPHPRLQERAFVLRPLLEIAPTWRHPVSGKSISELVTSLNSAETEATVRLV